MSRLLSLILTVVVGFLGFHDWNGNGVHDPGEPYAQGSYELHRTASDGAVDLTVVQYPPGVPYRLELEDGDQVQAVSGCGSWAVDVEAASAGPVGVPVLCWAVLAPMVGGGL